MSVVDAIVRQRLALGVEVVDALRSRRTLLPARVEIERALPWIARGRGSPHARPTLTGLQPDGWPMVGRHESGRHSLLYWAWVPGEAVLRIYDGARGRRFVPRRVRITIPEEAVASDAPPAERTRRISVFPGATYEPGVGATGIRGRLEPEESRFRWSRVECVLADTGETIAHAHADDRHEFVLVLPTEASTGASLASIDLLLRVRARQTAPVEPEDPDADTLWDLPIEQGAAVGGDPGEVELGERAPDGYVLVAEEDVSVDPGVFRQDVVIDLGP